MPEKLTNMICSCAQYSRISDDMSKESPAVLARGILGMLRNLLYVLSLILVAGCVAQPVLVQTTEPQKITAVGYGAMGNFNKYPKPQQRLLAMRAAKLDALRTLAEELYGTRVRGNTTIKDVAVEHDGYRSHVDAVVRGAHLVTVNPKGEGVYEAIVELELGPAVVNCLHPTGSVCSGAPPSEDMPVRAVYALPADANPTSYPQVYYFPE
jgi:hypothetical protein